MDAIEWLYGLQQLGVKLGLDNIRALLRLAGHPESAYRSVLVGGTNGKGSVAAMIHSMLGASGVLAGLYTSPHLTRPSERIRLGGGAIGDDELAERLGQVRDRTESALNDGDLAAYPSFFEVMTATALEAFRDHRMEAAVLEVGLGGRLDATNVAPADVSVVVGVDLDHLSVLGPTLERIAAEKAGIVRAGKPFVNGAVRQQAVSVLERACRERGAEWVEARLAARLVAESPGCFTIETARGTYRDLELPLAGRHQIDNARIALAAFELLQSGLGRDPDPDQVRVGLASVRWPGRLQWIRSRPGRPDLLLDGAHNPAAMDALASYLRELGPPAPVVLFGAMKDKAIHSMLESLAPLAHALVATRPRVERSATPADILHASTALFRHAEAVEPAKSALARAVELAGPERFVLITGSLYLVGEILALLEGGGAPGPVPL